MDKFSIKCNKRFYFFKFSVTSHGKGVIDEIGGNVESINGQKKGQYQCAGCKVFLSSCQQARNANEVLTIDKIQIETCRDPFNGCQTVPGFMSMHIISAGDDGVKLW